MSKQKTTAVQFCRLAILCLLLVLGDFYGSGCDAAARNAEPTAPMLRLRSTPQPIAEEDAQKTFNLNAKWQPRNYVQHAYEAADKVLVDRATGLMWQQAGAADWLTFADAQAYIRVLNQQQFAGHDDWRLPTLPELLSLLDAEKHEVNKQYIDPRFDFRQWWCWSADQRVLAKTSSAPAAWLVNFKTGAVTWNRVGNANYVRAVRSEETR
jgi:hypothetical protein